MTSSEWLALGALLAVLLSGLPLIRALTMRAGASPEVARKSVHVAMGLACLSFPLLFARPMPVWVLAAVATLPLGLLRVVPAWRAGVGGALHAIERPSFGEILFAPAVAAVFQGAGGDPFLYGIPVGILTLADAAGALAGTKWGRHRYGCGAGFKSIEGSLAFLVTAVACAFVPLWAGGRTEAGQALWIGLPLALLAMMAEGLADRGFDNLLIPLGCHLMLQRLLPLDAVELSWRFAVAAVLIALILATGRWSTLNGGALLGGALLGYGCAVLGDLRFLLPLLGVFLDHVLVTRRHRLSGVFVHRLDAVVSHAIGCLPWVLLAARGAVAERTGLAGVSFAMAAQLGHLGMATHWWLRHRPAPLWRCLAKGWSFAALPGLVWLSADARALAWPAACALLTTALAVAAFRPLGSQFSRHPTLLWIAKGSAALLASAPALMLEK